ncbi:MAG: glycosyltransferase family 2 protein [Burkholderiales bacterium]|jgi:cellulose synthase/poly-beta-1,6-N-acetylglucosamine synthase-like glycosyltransferase
MNGLALAVFVASAGFVGWTFVGYPAALWLWSRWRPAPVARAPLETEVAIVIVVHNEAAGIRAKIDSCLAQQWPAERLRVVVVSDGSTDATGEVVRAVGDPGVEWLPFERRRGKAACVNDALARLREPIVVLTDARQALHPEAVRRLAENFADPRVGAASGELVFLLDGATGFGQGVDAYWRYEKAIRRMEGTIDSVVGVTGAIYAIRREAFEPIPEDTVLDDVLIPMQAVRAGWRVVFDERAIAWDRPASEPARERVRKIRTLAGNFGLIAAHPWLLDPRRNRIVLQYLSHKVTRLLAPLALAGTLVSSAVLAAAHPLFAALLVAQLAVYAAPWLAARFPRVSTARPVRIAAAFVALNWFVVLGFREWLSNRRVHVWR